MELCDRLLAILAGPDRSTATRQLMAAGYTEDEVRGAWNFARAARLHGIESSLLAVWLWRVPRLWWPLARRDRGPPVRLLPGPLPISRP